MYGIVIHTLADGLRNHVNPLVIHFFQALLQLIHGQGAEIVTEQAVHMLLQRTDRLHQRALKIITNAHHFARGLHLGGQRALCRDKFIERKSRYLYHTIIQRGLKACIGFVGDGVFDFIQGKSQRNLGRHLGNGISGGLGCKRGGAAHTGIHLNHTIFKAGRMQRKLHIAPSGNLQFVNNLEGGGSKHLILLVAQGLGRRYHDTVPGMHTHRVNILHITYGDAVAHAVPHNLILDFFPARDTALHQHLSYAGQTQPVLQNLLQLRLVMSNAAAGAAQSVRRTKHHGIADGVSKRNAVLHTLYHQGRRTGLTDALHQILKLLASLRVADGLGSGSQQCYIVRLQETGLLQLHSQIQPRLSSQRGKNAVGLLLLNNLLQHPDSQRLHIHLVRNILVRHDRCRIGVHQNDLHAFFL